MSQNNKKKRTQVKKFRNQPRIQTQSRPATSSAADTLLSMQPRTSTIQMITSTSPAPSPSDFLLTPKTKNRASAQAQSLSTQCTIHEQLKTIKNLTQREVKLEETVEVMKTNILFLKNTSTLLTGELNNLKQYSQKSYLIISGVGINEWKNKWENGDNTENVVTELLTYELKISKEVFPQKLDQTHRLPYGKTSDRSKPPNIICLFKFHNFEPKTYGRKKNYKILHTKLWRFPCEPNKT